MAVRPDELGAVLEELIAALDRRVPRVEQAGEAGIARDAAALRAKAMARLAELGGGSTDSRGSSERSGMDPDSRAGQPRASN